MPWFLSGKNDLKVAEIPLKYLRDLKRYDLLGIDYLYQGYRQQVRTKQSNNLLHWFYDFIFLLSQLRGVILNEEDGFNVQQQVAIFLNVMLNYVEQKFLVLVLAPEELLLAWHHHLCAHAGLKVIIVGPESK